MEEEIEVKKDTDRQEEIRSLKRAWETAEPGRSAKAMIARSEFLKSHLIKTDSTLGDYDDKYDEDQVAELPASSSQTPQMLPSYDDALEQPS